MSSSIKVKSCAIAALISFPYVWFWVSSGLYEDYLRLANQASEVRLSLLTLWFPVGMLGFVFSMSFFASISLVTGKKADYSLPPKTVNLMHKIIKYFAILGVFTAIAFSWHCFNLLDEYGYQYNSKLTKFTPTGIHLVYTKP